jgi:hypothetical protein
MKFLGLFLVNLLAIFMISFMISVVSMAIFIFVYEMPMLASGVGLFIVLCIIAFFMTKEQMKETE